MSRKAGGSQKKSVKFSPEEKLAEVKVIENEDDMLLTTTNSPLKANSNLGQRIKKLSPVTGALESQETKLAFERLLKQASESMFDDDEDEEDGVVTKGLTNATAQAPRGSEMSPRDSRDAVARKLNIRTDSSQKEDNSPGTPATPTNRLETYVNNESPVLLTDASTSPRPVADIDVKPSNDGQVAQAADVNDNNNDDDDDDDDDDDLPSWAAKTTDKEALQKEEVKRRVQQQIQLGRTMQSVGLLDANRSTPNNTRNSKESDVSATSEEIKAKELQQREKEISVTVADKVMSPSQEELAARMRISQERVALQREQTRMEISRLEDQFRKYNINFEYSPGTDGKSDPNGADKISDMSTSTMQASRGGSPLSTQHEDSDEVVTESQTEAVSSTAQVNKKESNQEKDKNKGKGKASVKVSNKSVDIPVEKDKQKKRDEEEEKEKERMEEREKEKQKKTERDAQKALDIEKRMKATKQKQQEELRSSIEKERKSKDEDQRRRQDQKLLEQRKSLFASPTSEQSVDHSKDTSRNYDEADSAISSSAQAILAAYSNSMQSTSMTTDTSSDDVSQSSTTITTHSTTIAQDIAIGMGLPAPMTGANMGLDLGQGIGTYGTWYSETHEESSSMMMGKIDSAEAEKGSGGGMDLLDLMKEVQSRRNNTQSESAPEAIQPSTSTYANIFNASQPMQTETKVEAQVGGTPVTLVVDATIDGQESGADEQVHHKDKHTMDGHKHEKHEKYHHAKHHHAKKEEKHHPKESTSHHHGHSAAHKPKHRVQNTGKQHTSHSPLVVAAIPHIAPNTADDAVHMQVELDSQNNSLSERQTTPEMPIVSRVAAIDEHKIVDDLAGIENANKHLQYYTEYLHQFEKEFYRYFKEYDGVQATGTTDANNSKSHDDGGNRNSETGQTDASEAGDHVKSIDDIIREKKARLLKLQAFSFDELEAQVLQKHEQLEAAKVI